MDGVEQKPAKTQLSLQIKACTAAHIKIINFLKNPSNQTENSSMQTRKNAEKKRGVTSILSSDIILWSAVAVARQLREREGKRRAWV